MICSIDEMEKGHTFAHVCTYLQLITESQFIAEIVALLVDFDIDHITFVTM